MQCGHVITRVARSSSKDEFHISLNPFESFNQQMTILLLVDRLLLDVMLFDVMLLVVMQRRLGGSLGSLGSVTNQRRKKCSAGCTRHILTAWATRQATLFTRGFPARGTIPVWIPSIARLDVSAINRFRKYPHLRNRRIVADRHPRFQT